MATAPVKTANEWLSILTKAAKGVADSVPPGFKTAAQISQETGRSETQVRKYLKKAGKLGLVEKRKFKIETGDKLYPTPHFRICSSPKRSA